MDERYRVNWNNLPEGIKLDDSEITQEKENGGSNSVMTGQWIGLVDIFKR